MLDAAHIANAQLRTLHEFADHPQLRERNRWRDVESPVGALSMLLPPVTGQNLDVTLGPIPQLGHHTDAVRAEFGGG